jgi:hypothetical protein
MLDAVSEANAPSAEDTLDPPSVETQRMQAALEQRLFDSIPQPVKVGRFVLADVIGRGATGVVYRAIDVDLDRVIAVKLLVSGSEKHRGRLLREGRALARLKHPNVVAIHEVGEQRGQVFLAMEHVEGGSLVQWCARTQLGEAQRVALLCTMLEGCARGLAAAHAAGIIHRDLKPGNILVGADDRPRLADFGLARADLRGSGDANAMIDTTETAPPSVEASAPGIEPLTATGAVLGTPAYMAPEQLRGIADERSDQFGLCATFYEALWGTRAYAGEDLASLVASLDEGRLAVPPAGRVPSHVRRVLMRGLSAKPENRFPSVEALLAALERGRKGRNAPVIALGVGAIAIGSWLALRGEPEPIAPCSVDEAALDAAWGPARRDALQANVLGTGAPYAATTWSRLSALLDRLAKKWSDDALAACRQSRDPDPEVAAMGEARVACSARTLATFDAATAALAGADAKALPNLLSAADALGDALDCSAPHRGETTDALPHAVALDRALLARRLNQRDEAQRLVEGVLAAIPEGELPRLRATAYLLLARSRDDLGDEAGETAALQAAITEAELADEPTMLGRAWAELSTNAAMAGDRDRAIFYLERAKRLDRQKRLTPAVRAMLLEDEANIEQTSSRFAESAVLLERAAEVLEADGDLRINHAGVLSELSEALEFSGKLSDAVEVGERALARFEALVGPDHPFTAAQRGRVGRMYGFLEQESRVEEELKRALVVFEANPTFRPDLRAIFQDDLAQSQSNLGKHDEALATVEKLLATLRAAHGEASPKLASALTTRAKILHYKGDETLALEAIDQSLAIARTDVDGGNDMRVGEILLMRAEILAELGETRRADARAALDEALPHLAKVYAEGTAFDLQTAQRAGAVLGLIGHAEEAQRILEAGIVRAEAAASGSYVGRMHWELARIHARASAPAKAREHLAASRAAHVAFGSPQSYLDEIDEMERGLPR